jgi:hypothetical protein
MLNLVVVVMIIIVIKIMARYWQFNVKLLTLRKCEQNTVLPRAVSLHCWLLLALAFA